MVVMKSRIRWRDRREIYILKKSHVKCKAREEDLLDKANITWW
jgi:hypothetical protein